MQFTISTLCEELERLKNEHGDIPVVIVDADTCWSFLLKPKHLCVSDKTLEIGIDYSDEMKLR